MKPFDAKGIFLPSADVNGLRQLAVRGAGVTVMTSALGTAVQIVATVVLARLLTPSDFGLVTMVTTFSLLLVNFGLNGFTEAILQRDQLDHFLTSNLFWINVGVGLVLTAVFAGSGSLMARFYGNPRVASAALGVSLSICITSTSVLHLSLLKRAMRFSVVSANDILAAVISVAVSILLAWAGCGYWALITGVVVRPLSQSIGAWTLCRWVPSFPRRVPGTAAMTRFALNIYGRFSFNYFARNMDNLLVGWRFNAQSLGFYKKAYDLFALSSSQLVAPLTSVAVSALSRLNKTSEQYRRYLLNSLDVMALVGMGLGEILILAGRDVIRILLGPGWEPAARIFMFFGPGVGIMLLYNTHGWIHLSIGRPDRWFRWVVIEFIVTGLLLVLGLAWGPAGIALAWTASFWILTIPAFWYAGKPIGFGVAPILHLIWRYIFAALLATGACLLIFQGSILNPAESAVAALARMIKLSAVFGIFYLGAVVLLHASLSPLLRVRRLCVEMLSRRNAPSSSTVPVTNASAEPIPTP